MGLGTNYQKFKKHLRRGGLPYVFLRGIRYFAFLVRRQRERFSQSSKEVLDQGRLRIACYNRRINILWNDCEVTKGAGLNIAVNTLGMWTDSSRAVWKIIEKGKDYFKLEVVFKDLPLTQTWIIKIEDECKLTWQIDMEVEEYLHIDEFRMVCLVNSRYKIWVNNYQHGDFPRLSNNWQDICLDTAPASLVGARFPIEGKFLPSFALEPKDNGSKNLSPLIQNPPINLDDAHFIGLRKIDPEEKRDYSPGDYPLFSVRITLFTDDYLLDNKIESLRQSLLATLIDKEKRPRKTTSRYKKTQKRKTSPRCKDKNKKKKKQKR